MGVLNSRAFVLMRICSLHSAYILPTTTLIKTQFNRAIANKTIAIRVPFPEGIIPKKNNNAITRKRTTAPHRAKLTMVMDISFSVRVCSVNYNPSFLRNISFTTCGLAFQHLAYEAFPNHVLATLPKTITSKTRLKIQTM